MARTTSTAIGRLARAAMAMVVLTACNGDGRRLAPPQAPAPTTTAVVPSTAVLQVFAPWTKEDPIPDRYGCGGDFPALTWTGVPDGAVDIAVVVAADGRPTDVLAGVPVDASGLGAGNLPAAAFWWPPTEVGRGWPGLCGPDGTVYTFTVLALNQQLEAADDTSVTDLVELLTVTSAASASVSGQLDEPPTTPTT